MPGKAAQMLGITEEEVLELIKAGRLKANYLHNVASYMISHNDIVQYLKKTKNFKTIAKVLTHRVLLIDRDPDFQDLIQMELERGGKVQVKIATSDRDVGILINEFVPDLILCHLAATLRQADRVGDNLKRAKEQKKTYLIIYHNYAPDVCGKNAQIQEQIWKAGADEVVSISAGARALLLAVGKRLGTGK